MSIWDTIRESLGGKRAGIKEVPQMLSTSTLPNPSGGTSTLSGQAPPAAKPTPKGPVNTGGEATVGDVVGHFLPFGAAAQAAGALSVKPTIVKNATLPMNQTRVNSSVVSPELGAYYANPDVDTSGDNVEQIGGAAQSIPTKSPVAASAAPAASVPTKAAAPGATPAGVAPVKVAEAGGLPFGSIGKVYGGVDTVNTAPVNEETDFSQAAADGSAARASLPGAQASFDMAKIQPGGSGQASMISRGGVTRYADKIAEKYPAVAAAAEEIAKDPTPPPPPPDAKTIEQNKANMPKFDSGGQLNEEGRNFFNGIGVQVGSDEYYSIIRGMESGVNPMQYATKAEDGSYSLTPKNKAAMLYDAAGIRQGRLMTDPEFRNADYEEWKSSAQGKDIIRGIRDKEHDSRRWTSKGMEIRNYKGPSEGEALKEAYDANLKSEREGWMHLGVLAGRLDEATLAAQVKREGYGVEKEIAQLKEKSAFDRLTFEQGALDDRQALALKTETDNLAARLESDQRTSSREWQNRVRIARMESRTALQRSKIDAASQERQVTAKAAGDLNVAKQNTRNPVERAALVAKMKTEAMNNAEEALARGRTGAGAEPPTPEERAAVRKDTARAYNTTMAHLTMDPKTISIETVGGMQYIVGKDLETGSMMHIPYEE